MQINHLPNRRRLGNCKNSKFFHLCLHYLIFNAYYLTHIFTPLQITIKKTSFKNLVDLIVSVEPCEFTFCENCSEHGHLSNSSYMGQSYFTNYATLALLSPTPSFLTDNISPWIVLLTWSLHFWQFWILHFTKQNRRMGLKTNISQ